MSTQEQIPEDIVAAIDRLSENEVAESPPQPEPVIQQAVAPRRRSQIRPHHAVSFCVGLVIGLGSLAVMWQQQLFGPPQTAEESGQPSYYYGTLAPASAAVPGPASENVQIDSFGVTGTARAVYADQMVLVRLSLRTDEEIEVVLLYGDQLYCQGYRTSVADNQSLSTSNNQTRLTLSSAGDTEIVLHDTQGARPPVLLLLRANGQTIYEGTLQSRL